MNLYEYYGPVVKSDAFGHDMEIDPYFKASTYAESNAKARNNLIYRYKRLHGISQAVRLKLPGNWKVVE